MLRCLLTIIIWQYSFIVILMKHYRGIISQINNYSYILVFTIVCFINLITYLHYNMFNFKGINYIKYC